MTTQSQSIASHLYSNAPHFLRYYRTDFVSWLQRIQDETPEVILDIFDQHVTTFENQSVRDFSYWLRMTFGAEIQIDRIFLFPEIRNIVKSIAFPTICRTLLNQSRKCLDTRQNEIKFNSGTPESPLSLTGVSLFCIKNKTEIVSEWLSRETMFPFTSGSDCNTYRFVEFLMMATLESLQAQYFLNLEERYPIDDNKSMEQRFSELQVAMEIITKEAGEFDSEEKKKPAKACPLCNKTTSLRACSRCKQVFYCSREHQVEHWNTHKVDCKNASKGKGGTAANATTQSKPKNQQSTTKSKSRRKKKRK